MTKVRVLVVDDSLTVRKRLMEILASDADIEIVGEAADGKRAIELCRALRPDVLTLDMMLPVMSGLAVTEYIMAYFPTPILIVSASINRGELFKTYDALAAGAVDVLDKPSGEEVGDIWERRFLDTLKLVARIKVITHPRGRLELSNRATLPSVFGATAGTADRVARIVAIGASTGGPTALVAILRALPVPSSLPILIVLHIDEPFGSAFADWLDAQTQHRVRYAKDGEAIAGLTGRVVMAPPDRHLIVRGGKLNLSSDLKQHSCRPSVDALFQSLAQEFGSSTIACLLTGMGRDGAAGLLAIRQSGGMTIAQDEESSVVYGMPREAYLLGAAERVLSLSDIADELAVRTSKNEARER